MISMNRTSVVDCSAPQRHRRWTPLALALLVVAAPLSSISSAQSRPITIQDFHPEVVVVDADDEISTKSSMIIDGLYKQTGRGATGWQSCRILLSKAGNSTIPRASGFLDFAHNRVELEKGWAYVNIQEEPGAVGPAMVPAWVFITIRNVGAGANGTSFIVEAIADRVATTGARFYADPLNMQDVLLSVPCAGEPRTFRIPPGMYAEVRVTTNADGVESFSVNQQDSCGIAHDTSVGVPVPTPRPAFIDAAIAERARVGF